MVGMAGSGASTGIAVAAYELNVSTSWAYDDTKGFTIKGVLDPNMAMAQMKNKTV